MDLELAPYHLKKMFDKILALFSIIFAFNLHQISTNPYTTRQPQNTSKITKLTNYQIQTRYFNHYMLLRPKK